VCTLAATTLVTTVVAGLVALFITRGVSLVGALPGLVGPDGALYKLAGRHLSKLSALHLDPAKVSTKVQEEAIALGTQAAGLTAEAAGATLGGVLTLFFMALATYFVLLHWNEMVARAEVMLPFEPRHTHALLDQFRRVGRQVLRGTVVTGLVQGVFAGIGYAIMGVPDPAFFGALTAVASLVPAVGTLLVWVPIGLYLMMTGHPAAGICELIYAALFVGVIPDYVIRPYLVGSENADPTVLTFVSLFGGVEVFGLIGLVLGPVIVTLSIAVLRTYDAELHRARGI
jgi:predicted PurR-regulated permease PerM